MTEDTIEHYRMELRRAAWRFRYKQRIRGRNERSGLEEGEWNRAAEPCVLEAERSAREYVGLIPFDKGRHVIRALFLEGRTEAETAQSLRISQQGVSKWKRKSLEHLRRTLNS